MNFLFLKNSSERRFHTAETEANATRNFRRSQAFTMIEIAISLGVIVFALVAIIGVLPMGLNVQRDNRVDTIINQDGPYFLEAIRNGPRGLDTLTNFVDQIDFVYNTNTVANPKLENVTKYPDGLSSMTGTNIINLLSAKVGVGNPPLYRVEAHVRALSGSAVEQSQSLRDFAFSYLLMVEVVPLSTPSPNIGYNPAVLGDFTNQLYDVRLTFRWPLLPNGKTGPGRKVFRTQVSGSLEPDGNGWAFKPQQYNYPQ